MNAMLFLSAITGLILYVFFLLENERFRGLSILLSYSVAGFWLSTKTDSNGDLIIYSGLALMLLSGLISLAQFNAKKWVAILLAPIAAVVVLLLANGSVVQLDGNATQAMNKFVVLGAIIAAVAFQASAIKAYFIKLLKMDAPDLQSVVELIFAGLALYLGYFGASTLGLFMVSAILLVGAMQKEKALMLGSVLAVFVLYAIFDESANVAQADTILGMMLGFGLGKLSMQIGEMGGRRGLWGILNIVMALIFAFIMVKAGEMHPSMGGLDAVLAFILGIAISIVFTTKVAAGSLSAALIYLVLPLAIQYYPVDTAKKSDKNSEQRQNEDTDSKNDSGEKFMELNGDLSGKYTLLSDSSRVDFVMGEEGETTGAFKKVTGTMTFGDDPASNGCEIILDLKDFTTFNEFRDESVLGDDYLKGDKFPKMTYSAKKAEKLDENTWVYKGTFSMLGKTNPVDVTLQRITAEDGKVWLTGKGEIDRPKFGMLPSITEGNIVSFTYKVLVQK